MGDRLRKMRYPVWKRPVFLFAAWDALIKVVVQTLRPCGNQICAITAPSVPLEERLGIVIRFKK
eukprot:5079532-Ditylum_brightwellii.AAC.1